MNVNVLARCARGHICVFKSKPHKALQKSVLHGRVLFVKRPVFTAYLRIRILAYNFGVQSWTVGVVAYKSLFRFFAAPPRGRLKPDSKFSLARLTFNEAESWPGRPGRRNKADEVDLPKRDLFGAVFSKVIRVFAKTKNQTSSRGGLAPQRRASDRGWQG